jgi:hypothetical protein
MGPNGKPQTENGPKGKMTFFYPRGSHAQRNTTHCIFNIRSTECGVIIIVLEFKISAAKSGVMQRNAADRKAAHNKRKSNKKRISN